MKFELWKYECLNGHTFERPVFTGPVYGFFVLYSRYGALRSLEAFSDPVFEEVYQLLDTFGLALTEVRRAHVGKYLFGFTCDEDPQGDNFELEQDVRCPACAGTAEFVRNMGSSVDIQIEPVTHHAWAALSPEDKKRVVRDALLRSGFQPE